MVRSCFLEYFPGTLDRCNENNRRNCTDRHLMQRRLNVQTITILAISSHFAMAWKTKRYMLPKPMPLLEFSLGNVWACVRACMPKILEIIVKLPKKRPSHFSLTLHQCYELPRKMLRNTVFQVGNNCLKNSDFSHLNIITTSLNNSRKKGRNLNYLLQVLAATALMICQDDLMTGTAFLSACDRIHFVT